MGNTVIWIGMDRGSCYIAAIIIIMFIIGNCVTRTADRNYRTAAMLYPPATRFVSGRHIIINTLHKDD